MLLRIKESCFAASWGVIFLVLFNVSIYFVENGDKGGIKLIEIQKPAIAGTLESSDVQVSVEPFAHGIELSIESSVINQYGRQIKAVVLQTLARLGVTQGKVIVVDKGALECTLNARVECAVFRSGGISEKNIPWGGIVK